MATNLPPPPRKDDQRFDNWVFTLWKRAVGALVSGGVGATAPITITTAGTGTVNIGHGTSGVVTGTYGSQSRIPIVGVDTYGHLTLATSSDVAIAGTAVTGANLTVSSPLTGTATNALLRAGTVGHGTSGVTGGTYGAASTVSQVVVDTWGHVTSASSVNIAIAGTAVTGANLTVSAPLAGTATNALLHAGTVGHAVSGVIGGTYGGALGVPRVVVDTWGHVTAGTSFPLQATAPILVGSNAGTFTWGHSTSGIVTGTYGAASVIPQVVVNTYGHVTAVNTFGVTLPNLVTNVQNGGYVFGTGDVNNLVYREGTATGVTTWTVPSTLGTGALITLINDGTGNVTVTPVDTLVFAGTGATGNRTLPQYGMASVVSVGTSRWFISGAGVS